MRSEAARRFVGCCRRLLKSHWVTRSFLRFEVGEAYPFSHGPGFEAVSASQVILHTLVETHPLHSLPSPTPLRMVKYRYWQSGIVPC